MEFFRSNNNRILIDDEETKLLNNKHIGICSMELILWNNLTCRENLNLMGNMYKIPKKILKQKVERLLYELYLTYDADTVVSKLSDGVQRRLNLAMALIHEPQILIMDEPFHGLDHQSHVIIWNYIQSLRDMEKIVIINTHNLDEADSISDRIAIIDKGQIIRMDTPLNLKKDIKGGDLVDIKLSNPNKNQVVINSLKDLKDIYWVDEVNGRINLRMKDAIIKLPLLIDKIKESNVHLKNLSVHQNTLGEVFTELTGISLEESK
jgi:ABC-2 type transport system ATP-binding protein